MSWETRHGHRVYYHAYRQHGRVIKRYLGSGQRAQETWTRDHARQLARAHQRAVHHHLAILTAATTQGYHHTIMLIRAAYYAAGFHQHHRGEWRYARRPPSLREEPLMVPMPPSGLEKTCPTDLEALLRQAMAGDTSTVPAIRALLDQAPALWQEAWSLTRRVEQGWIAVIAKQDLLTQETLCRQVEALKQTLTAEAAHPLEGLLIETIATCFLAYKHAELSAADRLRTAGSLTGQHEQHLTSCQKRYLAAIRELARIRQLLTPRTTTVLNIAQQQQVNVTERPPCSPHHTR